MPPGEGRANPEAWLRGSETAELRADAGLDQGGSHQVMLTAWPLNLF